VDSSPRDWLDALAESIRANVAPPPGGEEHLKLHHVYSGGSGDPERPLIKPMPEQLHETPAIVVLYRGTPAILLAGSAVQRETHKAQARVYIARAQLALAYSSLVDWPARIAAAIPERGKLYDTVSSCVMTDAEMPEGEEWPPGSGRWYLVLPVNFEVKTNSAIRYKAQ
jgi:hypothetical protein